MSKNWTHPRDFSEALTATNNWNPDIVVRLYRGLNPSISRAEAIEAFKSLKLNKSSPYYSDPEVIDSYPINFEEAVNGNKWNWNVIYRLYEELGETDRPAVRAHFKTLNVTLKKPFIHAWSVPAGLLCPGFYGTCYIEAKPAPEPTAHQRKWILEQPRTPAPAWVRYLVEKHGSWETFVRLAYNTRVFYDVIS